MKKLYCVICSKYWKFENPKTSYHLEETLSFLLFAVSAMKMKNYMKKKNQLRYYKFLVQLKIYNFFKVMSQELRFENIDKTRNYFLEEIKQN